MVDKKILWNDAGRGGLVLGGVSIGYFVINALLAMLASKGGVGISIAVNILDLLLWLFKFILCIYLVKHLMKKFADRNAEADNSDTFRFGVVLALLSALIYSAFYFAWSLYIQPDMFSSAVDILRDNPMMDASAMEQFENMLPKMPTIGFFINFFWCFLFGTVLSAILSRNIPSTNPFAGQNFENK